MSFRFRSARRPMLSRLKLPIGVTCRMRKNLSFAISRRQNASFFFVGKCLRFFVGKCLNADRHNGETVVHQLMDRV